MLVYTANKNVILELTITVKSVVEYFFEVKVMKRILGLLLIMSTLIACSDENNSTKGEDVLTKSFVEENAEVGLTYDEVRERFGEEELSDVVDNTETWLYDSISKDNYEYEKNLEVVAFDEIEAGDVVAQLYINFIDEKAYMYSYFYLGEDNKIWQYQIIPDAEPRDIPVSN